MVGRPGKYATLFGGRQEEVSICLIKQSRHVLFVQRKKKHEKISDERFLKVKETTFDLSL